LSYKSIFTRGFTKEFDKLPKSIKEQILEALEKTIENPYAGTKLQGKKHWFLVCIDDYSRFLVLAEQFDHEPTTQEVTALLERQKRLPKVILSDHGSQFRENWKEWCKQHHIEPHFAHPSYPQDKGKVERCIQNLNREFVNHLRKFPGWLKGKIHEYRDWFNRSRFHGGIKAFPAELYECNVRNLT